MPPKARQKLLGALHIWVSFFILKIILKFFLLLYILLFYEHIPIINLNNNETSIDYTYSCTIIFIKSQYDIEAVTYIYCYKSTGYVEELILHSDSTFILNSYKISCLGKWKYINANTILINCDDVNLMKKIQPGYISLRNRDIKQE